VKPVNVKDVATLLRRVLAERTRIAPLSEPPSEPAPPVSEHEADTLLAARPRDLDASALGGAGVAASQS
jgi:hypothetical protein